jgi:hypothetical protein
MSLGQIRHSRRERTEQVLNAFGRFTIGRRRSLKERFERHPNDIRGPAAQTARGSPERTTELGGQSDRDLIFHERLPLCTAIVVQRIATGKKMGSVISLGEHAGFTDSGVLGCAQGQAEGLHLAANASQGIDKYFRDVGPQSSATHCRRSQKSRRFLMAQVVPKRHGWTA